MFITYFSFSGSASRFVPFQFGLKFEVAPTLREKMICIEEEENWVFAATPSK
jgi:hypothetical protein